MNPRLHALKTASPASSLLHAHLRRSVRTSSALSSFSTAPTCHHTHSPSSHFQKSFLFTLSPALPASRNFTTSTARKDSGANKDVELDYHADSRGAERDYRDMAPKEKEKAGEVEAQNKLGSSWPADSPPAYQKTLASGMKNGKLLSTPSRLLKLLLPLRPTSPERGGDEPLCVLVHPHQPLSYLERLVQAELPPIKGKNGLPARPPDITFHAAHPGDSHSSLASALSDDTGPVELYKETENKDGDKSPAFVRWSAATEVGDFVRDAAKAEKFVIDIEGGADIPVTVPSFEDRTMYLRNRLRAVSLEIAQYSKLKQECDNLAKRSAQKLAMGGFAGLITWWGMVYVLTFNTSLGWDFMEPVTYLAGLSTVMLGYLWFLYHNREVSYRSVLHLTVSRRQMKLYAQRGFDLDRWEEMVDQGKALKREIRTIAQEYDVDWDERKDEVGGDRVKKVLEDKKKRSMSREVEPGLDAEREVEPGIDAEREMEDARDATPEGGKR